MSSSGPEDGLPPLREVLAQHELTARKSLGQNFLLDLNLTRRIARAAGALDQVVEVGPGPGGLTRALLLEGARRVVAIERDQRCLAALAEIAEHWPDRLTVIEGDALKTDPTPHLEGGRGAVVANLPYNIGTELLVRWLRTGAEIGEKTGEETGDRWSPWWTSLTLMFQREVAERVVAGPGSKAYGRLSVLAGWRTEARILFDVSPRSFTPPPKVTSSVIHVTPLPAPRWPCRLQALERVTAAAFNQRRKMLRGSLKSLGVDAAALLEAAGVSPELRADALPLEAYCALARALDAAEA